MWETLTRMTGRGQPAVIINESKAPFTASPLKAALDIFASIIFTGLRMIFRGFKSISFLFLNMIMNKLLMNWGEKFEPVHELFMNNPLVHEHVHEQFMKEGAPQEPCGALFFAASAVKFFFWILCTLPPRVPWRFQEEKTVNALETRSHDFMNET